MTLRPKLDERKCFPVGDGKISPSGLVPAACCQRGPVVEPEREFEPLTYRLQEGLSRAGAI
jgi:hypothetical protein